MTIIEVKLKNYKNILHSDLVYFKPDYVITGEQGAIIIKEIGLPIQVAHLSFFDNKEIDLVGSFKVLFVKDGIVIAQLHLIK